jgi:hypothetical protein
MLVDQVYSGHSGPRLPSAAFNPLLCRLPLSDQSEYVYLASHFAASDDRNKRNLGLPTFVKHLGMIHSFVCRGDGYDALRGFLCGIEFGCNSFLVNTRQLKALMSRSKSCMNGCFQKLGYVVCRPARDIPTLFGQMLPNFACEVLTARQWCIRRAAGPSAVYFQPNLGLEIALEDEQTPPVRDDACPISSLLNRPGPERGVHRMSGESRPAIE